jgi:hypothetical protein
MEEALTAILLADARLSQVVGNRVHWDVAPQGAVRPYVILQVVSSSADTTASGRSGMETARVQIDAYGEQKFAVTRIVRFAFEALERARGPRGEVTIQGVFFDSARDLPASGASGAPQLFRRSTDINIIWHS